MTTSKTLIKFPSIGQYRSVVHEVKHRTRYRGVTPDGQLIMDETAPMPTLAFEGTVKLHGTNAALVQQPGLPIHAQSRNRILTIESDNCGFANFVYETTGREWWTTYLTKVHETYKLSPNDTVAIYGEWCGKGILGASPLKVLDKAFVIFAICVFDHETETHTWLNKNLIPTSDHKQVKRINDYQSWLITIDFDDPAQSRNELVALTDAVEIECPFAKSHGVTAIGEGIVWRCITPDWTDSRFWFKVKGEKHSATKVKTTAKVDPEVLASINEFVTHVVTSRRCEQGVEYLNEQGIELSKRSTGHFLKWVTADIIKEESDTLTASNLTQKQVSNRVNEITRRWWFEYLNSCLD